MKNVIRVEKDDKWGLVDKKTGKVIVPCERATDASYYENRVIIEKENANALATRKGKLLTPFYDEIRYIGKGLFSYGTPTDEKYGFMDKNGTALTPLVYDCICGFSCGLAQIKIGDKWGFVDKKIRIAVPCEYDKAYKFDNGLAFVAKDGKCGVIDTKGRLVIPMIYDSDKISWDEEFDSRGLKIITKDGKYGVINRKGKVIAPFIYDYLDSFWRGGLALAKRNGKTAISIQKAKKSRLAFTTTLVDCKTIILSCV